MKNVDQKYFNEYCAKIMEFETIDGAYDPFYNLHELAAVVGELIATTGKYPQGNLLARAASVWQLWYEFVISTIPDTYTGSDFNDFVVTKEPTMISRFNPTDYEHLIGTKWIADGGMGQTYTLTGIMLASDDYYWVMTLSGKFNKHTELYSCVYDLEPYDFIQTKSKETLSEYDTTPKLVNFADGVDGHYCIGRYNKEKRCAEYFTQKNGWVSAGDVFELGKG